MPDPEGTHSPTRGAPADHRGSGATGVLSFIVGGLVVAVGILGFVFWSGGAPDRAGATSGGGEADVSAEDDAPNAPADDDPSESGT